MLQDQESINRRKMGTRRNTYNICVYCSSSDAIEQSYFRAAADLGKLIALGKYTLIYGGANIGLMGTLAQNVRRNGGKVIGVIPKAMRDEGVLYEDADEIIVVDDLQERNEIIQKLANAFVALPGGFGTLEEILETLLRKQLHLHNKPVILVNINGYYDYLESLFEQILEQKFAKRAYRKLYSIIDNVDDIIPYLKTYHPPALPKKWFQAKSSIIIPEIDPA